MKLPLSALGLAFVAIGCQQSETRDAARDANAPVGLVWGTCLVRHAGVHQPPAVILSTFTWRNEASETVWLGRIRTLCGCEMLSWKSQSKPAIDLRQSGASVTVDPGESGVFVVQFKAADSQATERVIIDGHTWSDLDVDPWRLVVEYHTDNRFSVRRTLGVESSLHPAVWTVSASTGEPFGIERIRVQGIRLGSVEPNLESTEWSVGGFTFKSPRRAMSVDVVTECGERRELHFEYGR